MENAFLYKKIQKDERGMMAVEALIGFTIFMFSMLAMYSLIRVYSAQSRLAQALNEACESMAIESYRASTVTGGINGFLGWDDEETYGIADLIQNWVLESSCEPGSKGTFVATRDWTAYGLDHDAFTTDEVTEVAKQRFYAYLGGNEAGAQKVLEGLGVSELSFEGTGVTNEYQDFTLQIQYHLKPMFAFSMFGQEAGFETGQSVTCRMWKH